MRVLVSNGSNQFHLAPLASELNRRGYLAGLLTAGWPTPFASAIARPFSGNPAVQRFFNRKENVPTDLLHPNNVSELFFQIGIRMRRISEHTEQSFDRLAFAYYATKASRVLRKISPDIYHYRACYGLGSVVLAKNIGIPTICDHSIAHPGVLQYMVEHEGAWPAMAERDLISPLQQLMLRDIHQCDAVLVNSDFVKETCVFAGIDADRVHVVYLGVDDTFFHSIPDFDAAQVRTRCSGPLLFVGGFQKRKGAATLAKAYLSLSTPPKFTLIGGIELESMKHEPTATFLKHSRVQTRGIVPRSELARHMISCPIFVFPSYCEGSARVIFEAMACGCFIITTRNSGSIVRHGEHGYVVPAGDAEALTKAIETACAAPEMVADVGWKNAQLVRAHYRQRNYGDNVVQVYAALLR